MWSYGMEGRVFDTSVRQLTRCPPRPSLSFDCDVSYMFKDMSNEELRKIADDEEEFENLKQQRKQERRLDSMDIEEIVRDEFPDQFVALEESSRNNDYLWLYSTTRRKPVKSVQRQGR